MPADGCDRQCQTEKAQGPEPCASDDPTKGVGIEVCRPLPDHECCGGEAAAKMSSRRIRRIASVIGPQTSGMSAAFARAPLIRYHRSADIFSEECVHVSPGYCSTSVAAATSASVKLGRSWPISQWSASAICIPITPPTSHSGVMLKRGQ